MAKKLKWGTIEYLNVLIDQYFDTEPIPNMAGLCRQLNISRECWHYYTTGKWKVHRKSDEEVEEVMKGKEAEMINEAFEDLLTISDKSDSGLYDSIEDDHIKALVSDSLKKAHLRIDEFVSKQIFTAKNPAGSIFYAKAALGYRETAPESDGDQRKLPTTINIMVMPQPDKPKQLDDAIPTTYSVLADSSLK